MPYQYKKLLDWKVHKRKCRERAAVRCSDNVYEQLRVRIVRVVREHEYIPSAAEILCVSEATVRKYLRFVPFEHLMRNPALENRFDWRSMIRQKWVKLLSKHPQFISRLPRRHQLYCVDEKDILLAQPQLAAHFDLAKWNELELNFCWSELLCAHPEFADRCDFSVVTELAAKYLLMAQPQFFERIRLETLLPYHWTELLTRQPQLEKKMAAKPHSEWPFNYWVHALQFHPELEAEFDSWDQIDRTDAEDFQRRQPEMYARHWKNGEKSNISFAAGQNLSYNKNKISMDAGELK